MRYSRGGGAVPVWEKRWRGRAQRRIRLTAHVFAACQPLLREDLVWSVRIQARNYFAKYWTVRTINLEDCADQSGCEWVIVCEMCSPVSRSLTDEYKLKAVDKVNYISGEEGGVDGQDITVCDFYCFLFTLFNVSCWKNVL